jgi:leader peptidase (prepilin peptidase) / N-methyltransferase
MNELADLAAVPWLWWTIAGVVGLCVGSFINVVVHRLPRMLEQDWADQCAELRGETPVDRAPYNLLTPRSGCPACKHPIRAHENIPVLSYLLLKGKCAHCGARISPRYPVIELAAAGFAIAAAWQFGATYQALAVACLLWALLALSAIDIDAQLLPDNLTLPLLWAGLILNSFGLLVPLGDALWGTVVGYLVLWLVYWAFRLATGKEGMGYGDFKLLAALGAWLGWQMLPVIILLASVVGAAVGITLIVARGRDRNIPLPFGPYLAGAGVLAVFFGKPLMSMYLG